MLSRRLLSPPPQAVLPSGFTALDYITISSLDDRIISIEPMVGASDVVYLDHQFEEVPTWSSAVNANALRFWQDDYRYMYIRYYEPSDGTGYRPSYSYVAYEVGATNALYSDALTTERVLLCMPNSAYSLNGVIYPSTVLSTIKINNGVSGTGTSSEGKIQSIRYRIYGCYILDVFDWRHYMVPCLRVSDGREGLYDLMDGVFVAILYPNTLIMSLTGEITSPYPVASDLTLTVGPVKSISTLTVAFPKGSSSVTTGYRHYEVKSITPTYDDYYYYISDTD